MVTELEHEIEAMIAGAEPIEESDAVEVLATWRPTRTAMIQARVSRGLRPAGSVKPGIAARNHKSASKQDPAQLTTVARLDFSD